MRTMPGVLTSQYWDTKTWNLASHQERTELVSCFERRQGLDWHTSALPYICRTYRYFSLSLYAGKFWDVENQQFCSGADWSSIFQVASLLMDKHQLDPPLAFLLVSAGLISPTMHCNVGFLFPCWLHKATSYEAKCFCFSEASLHFVMITLSSLLST